MTKKWWTQLVYLWYTWDLEKIKKIYSSFMISIHSTFIFCGFIWPRDDPPSSNYHWCTSRKNRTRCCSHWLKYKLDDKNSHFFCYPWIQWPNMTPKLLHRGTICNVRIFFFFVSSKALIKTVSCNILRDSLSWIWSFWSFSPFFSIKIFLHKK